MLKKLLDGRIWHRIYLERLGEPLIFNVASAFIALFGGYQKKIAYDLIPRQPYAFGIQKAFEFVSNERHKLSVSRLVFVEFGVASGAGLLNICRISEKLSSLSGIQCRIIGFDTGIGMPKPVDYRDHPEKYLDGDFSPHDTAALERSLPANAQVIYGPIAETVNKLECELLEGEVIGFISIDVDYWSSTVDCMKIFDNEKLHFLPKTPVYFDDVNNLDHHPFAGELLAIDEFNAAHQHIKLSKMNQIRNWRVFKNALWLDQMYWFLDLGHKYFTRDYHSERGRTKLSNPYLNMKLETRASVESNQPD